MSCVKTTWDCAPTSNLDLTEVNVREWFCRQLKKQAFSHCSRQKRPITLIQEPLCDHMIKLFLSEFTTEDILYIINPLYKENLLLVKSLSLSTSLEAWAPDTLLLIIAINACIFLLLYIRKQFHLPFSMGKKHCKIEVHSRRRGNYSYMCQGTVKLTNYQRYISGT